MVSESERLHRRVRAFIAASINPESACEDTFDALATDIARFQFQHVKPVSRLAKARGISLNAPFETSQIPAVPTDVFRYTRVAAHDASDDAALFRTSGTTSGARGEHPFRTLETYNAAALAWGQKWLLSGLNSARVISLTPPPEESFDSSLVHMIALFAERLGGRVTYHLVNGTLDVAGLAEACGSARIENQPCVLFGTSFAYVHILDADPPQNLALPAESRAMLTGGFKGKSREVSQVELRAGIQNVFAIADRAVVGEYGMTELSSQLYETTLMRTQAKHNVYAFPPWMRVTAVDPVTLEPVSKGEVGIARIVDLANVDSAVAIQTADQIRELDGSQILLIGRQLGATPRGCSLAVEEVLG
ncbi:MAG: acyl-protein synthetase [Polyangiaceae bacterium]|nr:acyl-protein synthetase [Polyangiaceae bacterium]